MREANALGKNGKNRHGACSYLFSSHKKKDGNEGQSQF